MLHLNGENPQWSSTPPMATFQIPFGQKNRHQEVSRRRWGGDCFYLPMLTANGVNKLIISDNNGAVYHGDIDALSGEDEKNIRINGEIQSVSGFQGLKTIHGSIYVVGNFRQVVRRNGVNDWSDITAGDVQESARQLYRENFGVAGKSYACGFNCIDGFEPNKDLYAAGDASDVWHFNGQDWTPIDIGVANENITSICCADDGLVYLGCLSGRLFKGRSSNWQEIKVPFVDYSITAIEWFKDKIYLATSNRLYQYDGQTVETVNFNTQNGEVPRNSGKLDVGHGHLLSVGDTSITLFDGEQWNILYGGAEKDFQTVLDDIVKSNK